MWESPKPFSEAHYRALLEGLEITEVLYSECLSASYSQRLDSNYFQKEFIELSAFRNSMPLSEICLIRSGTTPTERDENLREGVILLKTANIRNGVLSSKAGTNFSYIDPTIDAVMAKTRLDQDDVLINIVGATNDVIGRCAILERNFPAANITQAMALLRLKENSKQIFSPKFLFVYLISKFGHQQIRRIARPTGQFNMNLEEVGSIPVPMLTQGFQQEISKLVNNSDVLSNMAHHSYCDAETLLLKSLGLANFKLSTEPLNIKSFGESFGTTGRLDAEYYLPKHEQLVARITASSHARLGALVAIQKSIEPGSDAYAEDERGLPFLRVADYSKQGITTPQVRLSERFVKENAEKLNALKPKQDAILFSKDGSVGEAYQLREDVDFITSGAILHLTVKDKTQVLPDYLTLILNSIVVKQQAERDAGGSIILHWRKEEIENVLVPIVDISIQQKISTQIQESFKFKAESERLLEVAKRAVEIAIERGEKAASDLIEKSL